MYATACMSRSANSLVTNFSLHACAALGDQTGGSGKCFHMLSHFLGPMLFFSFYMHSLYACMCVDHMCIVPTDNKSGHQPPWSCNYRCL